MRPLNILMTGGSRCVPLVQAFRSALRTLGRPGVVIVADVNPLSPAVHVADRAYRVPQASDAEYVPELLGICETERICLAVPTMDDELHAFGSARERFAEVGTLAACSSDRTAALCLDAHALHRHLTEAGVAAVATWLPAELTPMPPLPLFIKSREEQRPGCAFPVHTARQLEFFLDYVTAPVIQEYLVGPEYAIDVLCDLAGRPLSIVPRERMPARVGTRHRGRTVNDRRLIALAEAACQAIRFEGPVTIQCRLRGEHPTIFGITPKLSAGIPLTIQAGADFPLMLLHLALGKRLEPTVGEFRSDLWMTSFDSSFFLESPLVAAVDERGETHEHVA